MIGMWIMLQIKQRLSEYANRVFLGLESIDEDELQKVLEILYITDTFNKNNNMDSKGEYIFNIFLVVFSV